MLIFLIISPKKDKLKSLSHENFPNVTFAHPQLRNFIPSYKMNQSSSPQVEMERWHFLTAKDI